MKKTPLVILSDINGKENDDWMSIYLEPLADFFDIQYFDSTELAGIAKNELLKEEIHREFIEKGIEKAVTKLLDFGRKKSVILAFSIGGTIAWKAIMKDFPGIKLFAVSSTRLRKEYKKPKCEIDLYFGDSDEYRPLDEWFEEMNLTPSVFFQQNHEMYKDSKVAEKIVSDVIGFVA